MQTKKSETKEPKDRTAQLVAAREAKKIKLGLQSPRQRGDEKTRAALDWIYRWGWSSPSIIELVGGAQRSGLAARLVKRGFLQSTRTESGGAQAGVPATILTLTEAGQSELERNRTELMKYERDPHRIDQRLLRHDYLTQGATIKSINLGKIIGFKGVNEIKAKSAAGVKQPDGVWILPAGELLAVEVELNQKWDRDLDTFVHACILSLAAQGNEKARYQQIGIVSDSLAILKNYSKAFSAKEYRIWEKDKNKKWVSTRTNAVPAWVAGRVLCTQF